MGQPLGERGRRDPGGTGRVASSPRSADPDPFILQPLPDWALDGRPACKPGIFDGDAPDGTSPALYGFVRLDAAPAWIVMVARPTAGRIATVFGSVWPGLVTLFHADRLGVHRGAAGPQREKAIELARSQSEAAEKEALLEEVRASDQKKSNMIAVLSHEMRARWSRFSVRWISCARKACRECRANMSNWPAEMARSCCGLIDDVLELARLGAGQLRLEPVDFDPADVARDVAAIVGPEAQRKSIAVTVTLNSGSRPCVRRLPPRPPGSPQTSRRNALKFTHAGRIDISVTAHGPTDPGCLSSSP